MSILENNRALAQQLRKRFGQVRTSQGKNGIEYIVDCRECGGKGKCYVNPKMGLYICFKCGEKGPISRIVKFSPQDEGPAQRYEPTQLPTDVSMPGRLLRLPHLEDNHPAITYLNQRNFDVKELDEVFGVRYCGEGRQYSGGLFNTSNTLVFPMWQDAELVGWQARLLYNPDDMEPEDMGAMGFLQDEDGDYVKPPKYWTNPGLPKGRIFFNYDWARGSDVVVVTEGVFDAMAVGRCGVATLGKGVSPNQVKRLKSWPLVVLLLDPGDADKETVDLTYALGRDTRVLPIRLSGYKDAGEAPRYDIWAQIADTALAAQIDLTHMNIII